MFVAGFIGAPAMNFIPATVFANDAGKFELVIQQPQAVGGEVRLALDDYEAAGLGAYQGREVVLGVRPEDISRQVKADDQTRANTISCRVDVVEPTGADTLIVVNLGGKEVIARLPPKQAGIAGDEVFLTLNMAEASLFDPKTEQRI
jgi:multiple sugar transport system ATP-binding protein